MQLSIKRDGKNLDFRGESYCEKAAKMMAALLKWGYAFSRIIKREYNGDYIFTQQASRTS